MNIPQTRRCQRGVSAWTVLGGLMVVAGLAGLGVALFKPSGLAAAGASVADERGAASPLPGDAKPITPDRAAIAGTKSGPSSNAGSAQSLVGNWYDGGPGCVSLRQGGAARHLMFRAWYCEASESSAKQLELEYDTTVNAYVHKSTGLSLRMLADGQIEITARGNIRNRLGDGAYLAEEIRKYRKR